MSKNKQIISLIFKAVLIALCGYGIIDIIGGGNWYNLNYYTVLSNALVLIYFICSFIWGIRQLKAGTGKTTWAPRLEAAVMYTITITFLIYMFLLSPDDLAAGRFWTLRNIALHYIVPIMTIVDWVVFAPKGRLDVWTPLRWLLIPLTYFIYILVRAPLFGDIGPLGTPYPYGFIDIQQYGWAQVGINAVFIMFGMIGLGYIIYSIDKYLGRRIKK